MAKKTKHDKELARIRRQLEAERRRRKELEKMLSTQGGVQSPSKSNREKTHSSLVIWIKLIASQKNQ